MSCPWPVSSHGPCGPPRPSCQPIAGLFRRASNGGDGIVFAARTNTRSPHDHDHHRHHHVFMHQWLINLYYYVLSVNNLYKESIKVNGKHR